MKTIKTPQRLAIALIGAATLIGAAACGTTGSGSSPSSDSPASMASPSASMEGMPGSPMESSMGTTMGGSSASPGMSAGLTIHIKSFAYTVPDGVPAGATVTVMNMDNEAHTVTADDGSFNVVVKPGSSATFRAPAKAGTYPYHCTYHSNMHGTLAVT
ncbi:cupredoxin domain-containing protein [Pseudarthrobacter sp. NPDC080039]|uniref:cupredoxin domain-containing protein n=1 Tax=unclassified Pseudarthrobacter TaxID=2647000 RepID=UPI003450DE00